MNRLSVLIAAAAVGALATPPAMAQQTLKVGVLHCEKVPGEGVNLLIHSVSVIDCAFITPDGRESYKGEAGIGLGIDLEWSNDKTISYAVVAATKNVPIGSHALAGKYYGVRGSASVGVGVGAQVLVGSGDKNVTLQPLAVESGTGFGVAGGLGYLYLEPGD